MTKHLKSTGSIWKISFCVLLTAGGLSAFAKEKATAEKDIHRALAASELKKLDVETVTGDITIAGSDVDSLIIDAHIEVTGKKDEVVNELLAKSDIEVKEHDSKVEISPDNPKKGGYDIAVSFTVLAPRRVELDVSSVNGRLNITDIDGDADLSAINGGLDGKHLSGKLDCSTINGLITLEDVSGKVEASTINGGVECSCDSLPPKKVDFDAINGQLKLVLSRVPDADVSMSTLSGSLDIEGAPGVTIKRGAKNWEGALGAGGGSYEFNTVNGAIEILIKK